MLQQFLRNNRSELIERCRFKVAMRRAPHATPRELSHGVPLFLDQLTEVLDGIVPAMAATAGHGDPSIAATAAKHGRELLDNGFTIEQVVHDYGDLCQSVTELAVEHEAAIPVHEFGCLNITLDNAIASAVASYSGEHELALAGVAKLAANERLGLLANDMRNLLNTAILATSAMKRGQVGFGGATAAALDRSHMRMRGLIDRTLAEIRLEASGVVSAEAIEVGPFIAAIQLAATLEAAHRGCDLTVVVEPDMFVRGDRHILASAVANLLHGTLSSTKAGGHVFLSARSSNARVLIDVEDECAGMDSDLLLELLTCFSQRGRAGTSMGSVLEAVRKSVEAHAGMLSAVAIPGKGCLYTIDLPEMQ